METTDMTPLLEQLDDDIDELEEVLEPLLGQALSVSAQKMPVMDKAKLHVLVTYTIESLLFSYLRLHGVNAKEHPVFRELTRVRQYFEKIKALEKPQEKPTMTIDKEAAARFIKHGLDKTSRASAPCGNTDSLDPQHKAALERAEREAKEKAMAAVRAAQRMRKMAATPQKRAAEDDEPAHSGNNVVNGSDFQAEVDEMIRAEGANVPQDEGPSTTPTTADETPGKNGKGKSKRKSKNERRRLRDIKRARKASNQQGPGN